MLLEQIEMNQMKEEPLFDTSQLPPEALLLLQKIKEEPLFEENSDGDNKEDMVVNLNPNEMSMEENKSGLLNDSGSVVNKDDIKKEVLNEEDGSMEIEKSEKKIPNWDKVLDGLVEKSEKKIPNWDKVLDGLVVSEIYRKVKSTKKRRKPRKTRAKYQIKDEKSDDEYLDYGDTPYVAKVRIKKEVENDSDADDKISEKPAQVLAKVENGETTRVENGETTRVENGDTTKVENGENVKVENRDTDD